MNRNKTTAVSEQFYLAVKDYLYLLERNYPQKGMVKLVGDRYSLSSAERVLLYRGVVTREKRDYRKRVMSAQVEKGATLFIDGFNVIRTVGSYLNGNFIFKGMDGFVRDVSELHRKSLKQPVLQRSVRLVMEYVKKLNPEEITVYFDKPVSHSGDMVRYTTEEMARLSLHGRASAVFSPDHELREVKRGYICSADSAIIDAAQVPVFDLPAAVLEENFHPAIFSVSPEIL